MEMEQLHAAAFAYYNHGTPQLQQLAWSFFQSMDTNDDGRISLSEFYEFLQKSGYGWIVNYPSFYEKLDRNGDGSLDFFEVLTFYYIIKTRYIFCQRCGVCLFGLYFTCVVCFDVQHQGTYDLCAACYSNGNFVHGHTYFLDNHVLLRSKRGLPPFALPNLNMAMTLVPPCPTVIYNSYYFQASERRSRWYEAYSRLEMVVNAAVAAAAATASVAASCTIM